MKSPFFRPLCIAVLFLLYSIGRGAMRGIPFSLTKTLMIAGWILLSATAFGIFQAVKKQDFGWIWSFVGVLAGTIVIALLMLGLQKLGLIYQ